MGDGCLHRLTLLLPARQTVPDAFEPGSGSRQVSDHTATPWQVSLSRVLNLEQISGQAPSSANRITAYSLPVGDTLTRESNSLDPEGQSVLRADPVCLIPDRDRALLMPPESLGLTDAEVTALADDINQFLAEDKVKLHVAHPHRWYLIGEGLCSMYRLPPEQLAFSGVGVDADAEVAETPAPSSELVAARRRLRGLASEIEMFLYTHPVNEARRERSQPVVSGLYLWGAVSSLCAGSIAAEDNSAAERIVGVVGDDPWLHSAASTAQVPVVEAASFDELCQSLQGLDDETAGVVVLEQHERRHLLASDPKRATAAQAQFDASWIQPAQAALRSGQLQQIHYQYDNGQFSLETAPRGGAFSRWTKRLLGR